MPSVGSNSDFPQRSQFLGADQRDGGLWEKDFPTCGHYVSYALTQKLFEPVTNSVEGSIA